MRCAYLIHIRVNKLLNRAVSVYVTCTYSYNTVFIIHTEIHTRLSSIQQYEYRMWTRGPRSDSWRVCCDCEAGVSSETHRRIHLCTLYCTIVCVVGWSESYEPISNGTNGPVHKPFANSEFCLSVPLVWLDARRLQALLMRSARDSD